MGKSVLVIAGSPRKGGNSDILCDQFIKGCEEAGHTAEKIYLRDKKINFCLACYICKKTGRCFQNDDVAEIIDKMEKADVIVLASPVYFYAISGQMKTLIDRTMPCYYPGSLSHKDFYFIITAAEEEAFTKRALDALYGLVDCIEDATVKGIVYGTGAYEKGDVKKLPAMNISYKMGKNI